MGKINILGEEIASKIAAGEIIERPVSVVKELVENSIDAGSRNITIEIEKGGKKLIRVIDDGEGMSNEDIKLAFERHATSKINKLDDIFNVNTLGFRGEALASIASVSSVTVISKTQNESIGSLCKIKSNVIEDFREASSNVGSLIEVKDLFYNTPARLKFLSNDTQEASRITDLITRLAISNINISFRLKNDGKEIFFTSGNGNYREAIAKVYGVDMAKEAIYIEKDFDSGEIWGYVSTPRFNRGNRTGQSYFVNNRFIKDRGLALCLERAYKTMMPINRFPIAIIFIQIDNSLIDVNVHPAKTEIKFQRENEVHRMIFNAVKDGLKKHVLIPNESLSDTFNKPESKDVGYQLELSGRALPKNEYYYNNHTKLYNNEFQPEIIKEPQIAKSEKSIFYSENRILHNEKPIDLHSINYNKTNEINKKIENKENQAKLQFDNILGQLFNTYIIVHGDRQFYLIDQHAAHERILYEFYSRKYVRPTESQKLIEPYVLRLSAQEMMSIQSHEKEIVNMGFDFSIFGTDSVFIRAVPYLLNKPVDPIVLRDVLNELDSKDYAIFQPKERLIISMSCHTAIKAGDSLSFLEMQELLRQLKKTEGPYTCPHGRPTIIAITLDELEKKFKRK
ncbi:MAG: DNA mismatch repair endonuclease MutL [Tepidanaerobacteraceae bacterium]